MTPDDLARKALEEAHDKTCEWSNCTHTGGMCELRRATINRLARAAWEAAMAEARRKTQASIHPDEPSWLPKKTT